jgi:hypothetical protein
MCGSATLAIEESSTSMKVARVTTIAITHGFTWGCVMTAPAPGLLVVAELIAP